MQKNATEAARMLFETLEMRDISKRFPGVLANDHVDFDVVRGEVHALLGENGAGKSTLMKVLYGMYRPDEGKIFLNDNEISIPNPNAAISHGIGMIHQHFMLVPTLSVAENVALGLPSSKGPLTDLEVVSRRVVELGETYNLKINPSTMIWQLSVGQQQRVEIIKALYRGASLLLLDEPSSATDIRGTDIVEALLQDWFARSDGTLIFSTHSPAQALRLSDEILFMEKGKVIEQGDPKELFENPQQEETRSFLSHWRL